MQDCILATTQVRKTLVRPGELLKLGSWPKRTLELRCLQGAQPGNDVQYRLVWFYYAQGVRSTDSFELQWNTDVKRPGASQRQLVCSSSTHKLYLEFANKEERGTWNDRLASAVEVLSKQKQQKQLKQQKQQKQLSGLSARGPQGDQVGAGGSTGAGGGEMALVICCGGLLLLIMYLATTNPTFATFLKVVAAVAAVVAAVAAVVFVAFVRACDDCLNGGNSVPRYCAAHPHQATLDAMRLVVWRTCEEPHVHAAGVEDTAQRNRMYAAAKRDRAAARAELARKAGDAGGPWAVLSAADVRGALEDQYLHGSLRRKIGKPFSGWVFGGDKETKLLRALAAGPARTHAGVAEFVHARADCSNCAMKEVHERPEDYEGYRHRYTRPADLALIAKAKRCDVNEITRHKYSFHSANAKVAHAADAALVRWGQA